LSMATLEGLDLRNYDFLDFGAGDGLSMVRCQDRFGGVGLGIDVDPKKVHRASVAGRQVVLGDILSIPDRPVVRYVSMDNFLEHLPDAATAHAMIRKAAAISTDFIWIVHPSFDDEHYLRALGLKQYWHDWTGHTAHLLLCDLLSMLRSVGASLVEVTYGRRIYDSSDSTVLPLSAPIDQFHFDESKHGEKPFVEFGKPVFQKFLIKAYVGTSEGSERHPQTFEHVVQALRSRKSYRLATAAWRLRSARSSSDVVAAMKALRGKLLSPTARDDSEGTGG
jgi:hypothetical protein